MFIICSQVNVQKHEHYHYFGKNKQSKKSSVSSIIHQSNNQNCTKKKKIQIIGTNKKITQKQKNSEYENRQKLNSLVNKKNIKQKSSKGLSKTCTTNTTSFNNLPTLNLDFTKKVDSRQINSINDIMLTNKIKQQQSIFKSSNRFDKQSFNSNHDTLITFKKPTYIQQKIKHKRLQSHNVNTVISQQCVDEDKQYVIQQSFIYDHNVTNLFTQMTPTIKFKKYEQFLALSNKQNSIISVKSVPIQQSSFVVSKQLRNYKKINNHPNILDFYQANLHFHSQLIIKQPYTQLLVNKKLTQTDIQNILVDMNQALNYLKSKLVYMDWITIQDIRQVLGVYKLSDISRSFDQQRIQIHTNLLNLRNILSDSSYY